jgi:hypothetical protein
MIGILVHTIDLPQYQVDSEPHYRAIGRIFDDELKNYFLGQSLVIRGIASSEHPGKTVDELIEIIKNTGTDRYNPERKGDRYENSEGKRIDFFAFPVRVDQNMEFFHQMIWGFYHSAKAVHGYPVRIDIVTIYDAAQLQQVEHQYEGQNEVKDDGFTFKFPANKPAAVKAIFKLADR